MSEADRAHPSRSSSLLPTSGARGDIGIEKPDPRIFLEAARRAGRAPEECVYVGDRLETDALAAGRAGMTGVWLDRAGRERAPEGVAAIRGLGEPSRLVGAG